MTGGFLQFVCKKWSAWPERKEEPRLDKTPLKWCQCWNPCSRSVCKPSENARGILVSSWRILNFTSSGPNKCKGHGQIGPRCHRLCRAAAMSQKIVLTQRLRQKERHHRRIRKPVLEPAIFQQEAWVSNEEMTTSKKRRLATVKKLARRSVSVCHAVFVHWENMTRLLMTICKAYWIIWEELSRELLFLLSIVLFTQI